MKTLMRNGRDRRSENPSLGHAKKERVSLFGTDQRITSGPVARRPHSKAEYMTAPERFADSQIPLAPRAPSIHDPPASGAMSEDGPEPSRAWWCWRAQLIHAAHHHPVIENAVVLQVRVDRRCLEPGRAKGERHHYKPYRV